jgi:hypothetical protein
MKNILIISITLFLIFAVVISSYLLFFDSHSRLDTSSCDNLPNKELRDYCIEQQYFEEAVNKGDLEICEKVDEENRDRCRDEVYSKKAASEKDISLCENVKNSKEKEYCYLHVAEVIPDPDLCEKIQTDYVKDNCYINVARVNGDVSICERINKDFYKEDCFSAVAQTNNDPSLCKKIPYLDGLSSNKRYICYSKLDKLSYEPEICDYLFEKEEKEGGVILSPDCFAQLAVEINDPSVCERITNYKISSCYYNIAQLTNNSEICNLITTSEDMKRVCYKHLQ